MIPFSGTHPMDDGPSNVVSSDNDRLVEYTTRKIYEQSREISDLFYQVAKLNSQLTIANQTIVMLQTKLDQQRGPNY